jgi:hypothetical protein
MDGRRRAVARTAATAFGGTARVARYHDADASHAVDLLACSDGDADGLTSYSTVTLHMAENRLDGQDIRIELAAVAPTAAERFANALATAALNVMKDGWLAAPGVVFPGLLAADGVTHDLPHVLWVEPVTWPQLGTVEVPDGPAVHWLQAIPISESERRFLAAEGFFAIERRLEEQRVAFWDLSRPSTV